MSMVHRFVLHNGRVCEAGDALLSPGQLGLLSGWGVFSTLRVDEGVLFEWDRHWARMTRDAALMNIPMPVDSKAVKRDMTTLIDANHATDSVLRLVVVRNGGGMWEGPANGYASDVIALTANKNKWGTTVRLTYQPNARYSASDFTRAKILSWSQNLCWYERAHENGFDECILLNEHGEITECTSANIFIIEGNRVWTAPVEAGCLPGVTRDILLHEIRVPGIEIGERTMRAADLESADEVFITSTTRDLLLVSQIEKTVLNPRGAVRAQLQQAFRSYLQQYVSTHRAGVPVAG